MCYNKEVSMATYVLGVILSTVLFIHGDKYDKNIAIFSFVFIHMQLCEYFMWSDQKCGKTNHYATIFAHFLLVLQPLSIILGMYILNTSYINNKILRILLFILIIVLYKNIELYYNNNKQICSKKTQSGYIEWNFVNGTIEQQSKSSLVIYFSLLIIPWLFFKNKIKGLISFLIIFLTLGYSLFVVNKKRNLIELFKQWESKWCFIGIIYPIIFLCLKIFE